MPLLRKGIPAESAEMPGQCSDWRKNPPRLAKGWGQAPPGPDPSSSTYLTSTVAAAVMPHSSSTFFFSSTSSSTDIFPSSSNTLSVALAAITAPPPWFQFQFQLPFQFQIPPRLVALSHFLRRVALSHFLRLVALSHLLPRHSCRPAPGAARCGRRSGRTGPAAAP